VHGKLGAAVEKLLPKDLNPKIKEQIEAATKPPGSPPLPADERRAAAKSAAESAQGSAAGGLPADSEGRYAAPQGYAAAASPVPSPTKSEGAGMSSGPCVSPSPSPPWRVTLILP
jgi:hypothetical protein